MAYLHQGRIFWAEVPNLHGDGEKRRPLVIVSSTATANDRSVATVKCVACSHSTALLDPLPLGCVLLPPVSGKQRTRLSKPTAAVADWVVEVAKADIPDESLAGSIGGVTLATLLQLMAAAEQKLTPDESDDTKRG